MDIVERLRNPNIIRHDGQFNLCDEAADEIERLRAEVAALKAPVGMEPVWYSYMTGREGTYGDVYGPVFSKVPPNQDDEVCDIFGIDLLYSAAQLAQVQRERDEYKKDAERYRWLRSKAFPRGESCVQLLEEFGGFPYVGETVAQFVDRYIDAAMQKEKE